MKAQLQNNIERQIFSQFGSLSFLNLSQIRYGEDLSERCNEKRFWVKKTGLSIAESQKCCDEQGLSILQKNLGLSAVAEGHLSIIGEKIYALESSP